MAAAEQISGLTAEQMAFFKAQGYLLIPGLLDVQRCAEVRDLMWDALPENAALSRHDPSSHVGPFSEFDQDHNSLHVREGYRWLNRRLGVHPAVVDLVYGTALTGIASQLLGDTLREPVVNGTPMGSRGPAWPGGPTDPALGTQGARGVYCTLPYGGKAREPDRCHTDGHPFQLGVVALLDETPSDGGAFKVWPGSHQRLFPTFTLRYDQPRIPYYDHLPSFKGIVHNQAYLSAIDELNEQPPIECWGGAGDVVIWHHRLAHMAGHNYSNVIRQAVLGDFSTTSLDTLRARPPHGDMWADWSKAMQQSAETYSDAFARQQCLPGATSQT